MSREAEEAYERSHQRLIELWKEPGVKVWRGEWNRVGEYTIIEGVLDETVRGKFNWHHNFEADPNGTSYEWCAKFPTWQPTVFRWYRQTCDGHEFSSTRAGAIQRVIGDMERALESASSTAKAWQQAIERARQELSVAGSTT